MKITPKTTLHVLAVLPPSRKYSSPPNMTKLHWLEITEYVSLYASAIGTLAATATQQVVYAAFPLTVALGLNLTNRERLKRLNEQYRQNAIAQFDQLVDPFRQRLENFDDFTQRLSQTTQQQIDELRQNQKEQNTDSNQQRLAQFNTFRQQLMKATELQIEPLKQHLTQLNTYTQQLYTSVQQIEPLKQNLTQLNNFTQQLNASTQKQFELLRQQVGEIDAETKKITTNFQQPITKLDAIHQRVEQLENLTKQINTNTQQQIQPLRQYVTQLNAYTQGFNKNTEKQLEEFKYAIALLQTEIQNLAESLTQTEQRLSQEVAAKIKQPQVKITIPTSVKPQPQNRILHLQSSEAEKTEATKALPPVEIPSPTPATTQIQKSKSLPSLQGHTERVVSVAFHPNSVDPTKRILASGSHDKTIKIWRLDTQENRTLTVSGKVNSIAFSPDGKILACGHDDKTVKLWDVNTEREIYNFIGHKEKVYAVAFSPNGKIIASGSQDKTIKLWSLDEQKEVYTLTGHIDEILCVAFSPNNRLVASGGGERDQTIKIWHLTQDKFLTLKGKSGTLGRIYSICFSPDGTTLASGHQDKIIRFWDVETGREISNIIGHNDEVYAVAFSPDGRNLASGSYDGNLKIWQVDTGEELNHVAVGEGAIYCVAYSPDGKIIATANGDKTVALVNLESRTAQGRKDIELEKGFD
ncbi:hypothetical protein [Fischerella sp. JS2]|uniref:WD40 domain-containing protein n=1 Tax=Fischerella sp. JS2 TaxID=2597771 RepID=UPI0028E1D4F1|nr:hypothetical protein [Fischerella sp. JS2]